MKLFGEESFIYAGQMRRSCGNSVFEPDFTIQIDREFVNEKFIDRDKKVMATIIGETAISETTEHLMNKCQRYISESAADIVIGIDMNCPKRLKDLDANINSIDLYIWYDKTPPQPIRIVFDELTTFTLKVDKLKAKFAPGKLPAVPHSLKELDVKVFPKRKNIFQ